jgi:5-methylthioadenosine/S-adenosylhomocysteine deaminase
MSDARGTPPDMVDLLITGTHIVTMDSDRRIITDGAIAVRGDRIVAVGKSAALKQRFIARDTIDGQRFV